jgi:putative spermidine/putrescine transport system substrate-binding protein
MARAWALKLSLFAGAVAAVISTSASGVAADSITIASFGGAYSESQKKAYTEPFQKEAGIPVNMTDYNGGLGEIRAQVEAGTVTWDVVDVEMQDAVRGCDDGLFESLKDLKLPAAADGTQAADDFLPGTLTDCGVGSIVWSTIVAYRNDSFASEKPTTIFDFFDTAKFPGKRGAMKKPQTLLEWALIADGVPKEKVYETLATEEGVARAFAKLDTLKADIVWWEAHAQAPQLLADGEVAMTMAANGRIFDAIFKDKQPFTIVWDHQIWNLDLWSIPKGSPRVAEAKQFIAFAAEPARLAAQTQHISYGPVRKSAAAMVDEAIQAQLPTAPTNFATALQNDFQFWADHGDALNERFNVWLNR